MIMKICTKCLESKSLSEFYKNKSAKLGVETVCKECFKIRASEYRNNNKEKIAKAKSKHYQINRELINGKNRASHHTHKIARNKRRIEHAKENKDMYAATQKRYRDNNKEKDAARRREYRKENNDKLRQSGIEYRKANKSIINTKTARRRAAKLNATPAWADYGAINEIYELSAAITDLMEPTHVDHIIPLQGKNVCGLHVEYNLQVLRAEDNLSKGNKHAS